jgi:dihydrofolate synthase/folylpolyglutamate synthase
LVHKLGEEYEVQKTIIKKWSTGGPIQSPLEAVSLLRERRPFEADDVRRVTIRVATSAADKIDDSGMVNLSMQYLIAVMLIVFGLVLAVADRVARRYGDPTEFELLTAVVFARFAEVRPDLAVVEVGLGGRLDATHAWDGGVAVVTNVDLDHMDRLGDTIPKIAHEKAAIIERGDLAVTGARGDGLSVIRRRARRMGVPLTEVTPPTLLGWDRDGIEVDLPRLGPTRIGLRGRHQAANAAIADATLDALEAAGIVSVPPDARRRGYAAAVWPGRLELLRFADHDILLDGAHNPAGAAALAASLDDLRPYLSPGPMALVTASMADKDVDGVIWALAGSAALADSTVICTSLDVPRALPAADLAARWRALRPGPALVEPDPIAAIDAACEQEPELAPEADLYRRRRLSESAAGALAVIVGHADLLVLP